jgi:hypothetical protein
MNVALHTPTNVRRFGAGEGTKGEDFEAVTEGTLEVLSHLCEIGGNVLVHVDGFDPANGADEARLPCSSIQKDNVIQRGQSAICLAIQSIDAIGLGKANNKHVTIRLRSAQADEGTIIFEVGIELEAGVVIRIGIRPFQENINDGQGSAIYELIFVLIGHCVLGLGGVTRNCEIDLFQCLADSRGTGGGRKGGAIAEQEGLELDYELGESISHIVTGLIV